MVWRLDAPQPNHYLVASEKYGEYLYDSMPTPRKGLVLIAGETGCGKTTWLNSLGFQILKNSVRDYPHVVAVGDPVETLLYPDQTKMDSRELNAREVRFTARTLEIDVETVEYATIDALRETPVLFVISELRQDEDFVAALRFAGTGHLVLATAHATSLVDAMTKLIRIEKATSASDRSIIAQRLAMLVFLNEQRIDSGNPLKLTMPKVWRNNSSGARSFIAEGLSSLQVPGQIEWPKDSSIESPKSQSGMLSYRYAVGWLKPKGLKKEEAGGVWRSAEALADRLDLRHE